MIIKPEERKKTRRTGERKPKEQSASQKRKTRGIRTQTKEKQEKQAHIEEAESEYEKVFDREENQSLIIIRNDIYILKKENNGLKRWELMNFARQS